MFACRLPYATLFPQRCNANPLTVFPALCGYVADRTSSRRLPLLSGLLMLCGATILLCVGTSIATLIVGRMLQGASAAIVWTVGLALIVDTCPDDVATAMGYVSVGMSLAVLIAPLLGGVVFAQGGYYDVFAMCFGLIALDIMLRLLLVEKKIAKKWLVDEDRDSVAAHEHGDQSVSDDAGGAGGVEMTSTATPQKEAEVTLQGKNAISADVSSARSLRTSTEGGGELAGAGAGIQTKPTAPTPPTFTATSPSPPHTTSPPPKEHIPSPPQSRLRRLRSTSALPPVLTLLLSRRLLAALWSTLVLSSLLTAFDSVLPLYVRQTFHWTSTGAGLAFLPLVLPSFASPLIGAYVTRHGPRLPATAGFLLPVPFLACLGFVAHDSLTQKVLLCALLVGIGAGITLAFPPLMAEIAYVVADKERRRPGAFGRKGGAYAQAYALFNMAYAAGCLVGPIWGGMVRERAGWGAVGWSLAILCGCTAVPAFLWVGGWVFGRRKKEGEVNVQASDGGGGQGDGGAHAGREGVSKVGYGVPEEV